MVVEMARHRSLRGGHVQLSYLAATGWYRTLLLDKAGADRESRHPVIQSIAWFGPPRTHSATS
jgi:hypothetical protein